MEVTALCIRPTMIVSLLLLLVTVDLGSAQRTNYPQVDPYRQQHFEYGMIVVSCEGLDGQTGWRVIKKVKGHTRPCRTTMYTTGPCPNKYAIAPTDSGEYWCEKRGQKKSSVVNITVTGSGVILESPVHAVKEGDAVNLSCRKRELFSNLSVEFFKHGHFIGNSSTGNLTIPNVSTSDEGYYSCKISGEESLKSWLAVRAEEAEAHDDDPSSHFYLLVITGLSILALLLLVGFVILRKRQTIFAENTTTSTYAYKSSSDRKQTRAASATARSTVPSDSDVVYALVTRPS